MMLSDPKKGFAFFCQVPGDIRHLGPPSSNLQAKYFLGYLMQLGSNRVAAALLPGHPSS